MKARKEAVGTPALTMADRINEFLASFDHTPLLPPGTLMVLDRLSEYATLPPELLINSPNLAKAEANQLLWQSALGNSPVGPLSIPLISGNE